MGCYYCKVVTTINNLSFLSSNAPLLHFSFFPQTYMSASGTTSFHDPTRPALPSSAAANHHLPPDPLLSSGAFIHSSSSSSARNHRRSPLLAEPLTGKKLPPDPPGNGDSPAAKKAPASRNTTASPKSASLERPDWLPPGWVLEDRVRTSGATAGTVDKYYFDPTSGHRFRSKIEVLYFLETGTRKRKKDGNAAPADGSEEPKSKKSSSKAKPAPLNFNYFNVPEKVEWVLTDPSLETWTPFINNEKVPESTKSEWMGAFYLLGRSKAI